MLYQAVNRGRKVFYYPESFGFNYKKGENQALPMSPSQLVKIPEVLNNSVVLIDEIQELLSKYRANTTATMMIMSFFRQVRKRGCRVYFTSNDPDNINPAVANQCDYHAWVSFHEDKRCHKAGYHLIGNPASACKDYLTVRLFDTQKNYKKGNKDSLYGAVTHVSRMYKFYDTTSVADVSEVLGLTKASVLDDKQQESIGMSWRELDNNIEEVIGSLVAQGFDQLVPRQFVKVLFDQKKINIPDHVLGKRLTQMGLSKNRRSGGYVYHLPPDQETYEKWINGVWAFDD